MFRCLIDKVDKYMLQKKQDEDKKLAEELAAERKAKGLPSIDEIDGDVPCDVFPNGDGTYTVEYVAAQAGTYQCHVQVGIAGNHVKKSPKKIPVRWRCPNAPCQCTMKELQGDINEGEDSIEILKQAILGLQGGNKALQKLKEEGKIE